jgi:integrase
MLKSFEIDNAKPREKPYQLTDGMGLSLLVKPSGKRLWRFRYHFRGKANMLSLGSFPEVSLAIARGKCNEARKLLAEGKDPSQQRKADKIAAATAANNTFKAVAEEYIGTLEERERAQRTIDKAKWLLHDLASSLSQRPISEITPAEILLILKRIEKLGQRETARRLRAIIGRVFRLAVSTLRAPSDPTYSLQGAITPPVVTSHAAITDEREFGALMLTLDEYIGWPTLKALMQFLALTMIRPGEARLMRRNEIIWPRAMWSIPAERMKMRLPHDVPLSRQALAILRDIWPASEHHQLVFPSVRSPLKALSDNAMNSALRRMGYMHDEMTAHGFRSSASTILNGRHMAHPDVIETALAHKDPTVRGIYNRAKYWPERVQLLQDWADLIDQFKSDAGRSLSVPKVANHGEPQANL